MHTLICRSPRGVGDWLGAHPAGRCRAGAVVSRGRVEAADRLTVALGSPLWWRPRVTAAALGHLVRAGLLVYLGGEALLVGCPRHVYRAAGLRLTIPRRPTGPLPGVSTLTVPVLGSASTCRQMTALPPPS